MGKGGRIACIFTPYILTMGALACIIMVGLGVTKPSSPLNSIYFAKVDLKDIDLNSLGISDQMLALGKGLQQAQGKGELADYYLIGLWNYCYGDYKDNEYVLKECTDRKAKFWFDPAEAWDLPKSVEDLYPKALDNGLKTYKKVAGWMFIAYAIAFFATIAELVVGISAIFSRWGSLATTICAFVATTFTFAASITATAMYAVIIGAINTGLKDFKIKSFLGRDIFILTWLAAAFSLASGLFWLFSVCCCSGRSPYNHKDKRSRQTTAEKTPYTYERVSSPYGGPQQHPSAMPLNPMPAANQRDMAYEPFRHA
ncbi:hypothetical protein AJ80_06166 [Polytolypa hystricis UAMH7299]|uniref:Integral membrane protein n=1 Tax=Polytolypa hystricis (strain UAMH7299) TaxID=1447883 RepID=A0A2B7XZJ7_POLH7|nr:hypothetical protein AJ80_06166 [Polytolypa hystricis UAMH7299]